MSECKDFTVSAHKIPDRLLAPLHLLLFGETLADNGIHSASRPPRERHTNPYALPQLPVLIERFEVGPCALYPLEWNPEQKP